MWTDTLCNILPVSYNFTTRRLLLHVTKLFCVAEGLDTGKEYEFRVLAKNLAGLGEPSQPSKSVVTKPKAGQRTYQSHSDICLLFTYLRSQQLLITLLPCNH